MANSGNSMLKSRTSIDEFTERDQEIMHSSSLSYELFNSMLKKVLRRLRLFLYIFKEVRSQAFLAVLLAAVLAAIISAVLRSRECPTILITSAFKG